MARNVTETLKRAGNQPETSEIFLTLLKLDNVDLSEPILAVNNNEDIVHNAETYTAVSFQFIPPSTSDEGIQPAKLTMDNVDRRIVKAIRSTQKPIEVEAKIILASDPEEVEVGPFEMILKNVSYNFQTVSGDLIYLIYTQDIAGTVQMNNQTFPGLIEWT